MTDITLPIWLFAVSAGVPCISFLSLLVFILRKIRKPHKDLFVNLSTESKEEVHPQRQQFHHDLLAMQIDTIFNGLTAIIESERLKMNALLNNPVPANLDTIPTPSPSYQNLGAQPVQRVSEPPPSLESQIATIAATGGQTDEIADEMGLSQAEVELALQMRSSRKSMEHRKLEAVA